MKENPEHSCSGFSARMAYDHCESRKSASSRGRFHPGLYEGVFFDKQKTASSKITGDLLFVVHKVCGLLTSIC
ncbi:hypothetical protein B4V02_04695 [Paenibacillus kribbensis]|uniref:Uncharacterized protein n=1 Tax=Paenibacillus kribbensis TaxID=172713 RepID=A0A222WII7_9BACL|nr:hypothetical protein B4V02_04695 [Paenibacillus kribbensis]